MRRFFESIVFIVALAPLAASANTQILFSKDGSKATITLLAFTENPDSTLLFKTLVQAPVETSGKISKRVDFTGDDGRASIDISCVFSKLSENTGSCILVLHAGPALQMDPGHGRVQYALANAEAQRLAKEFILPPAGTQVYRSSDGLLNIGAVRNSSGAVVSFILSYGN